jgi:hypothetical protein
LVSALDEALVVKFPAEERIADMTTLSAYRRNIYSQNGEDGVLEEILRRLQIHTGSFVEFGAWDGRHLSNTYHLLEQGWSGVYIEADGRKFQDLEKNMKPFAERIQLINAYVEPSGAGTLDALLASTRVQRDFEVLSIDIDSYDWHVWQSLRDYSPAVVVIEINSSVPVGIYQTHRGEAVKGSSFSSTVDLGTKKGYTLVCHTGNLMFVRNNLLPRMNLPQTEVEFPESLFDYSWKRLSYETGLPKSRIRLSRTLTRTSNLARRCARLLLRPFRSHG